MAAAAERSTKKESESAATRAKLAGIDRGQVLRGPGCNAPISTEFSSLNTTGVTADTPGPRASDAKLGGWGRGLRALGVTRRSEPTTNLRVGGLRVVVGGGEHREADPEGDHQADADESR